MHKKYINLIIPFFSLVALDAFSENTTRDINFDYYSEASTHQLGNQNGWIKHTEFVYITKTNAASTFIPPKTTFSIELENEYFFTHNADYSISFIDFFVRPTTSRNITAGTEPHIRTVYITALMGGDFCQVHAIGETSHGTDTRKRSAQATLTSTDDAVNAWQRVTVQINHNDGTGAIYLNENIVKADLRLDPRSPGTPIILKIKRKDLAATEGTDFDAIATFFIDLDLINGLQEFAGIQNSPTSGQTGSNLDLSTNSPEKRIPASENKSPQEGARPSKEIRSSFDTFSVNIISDQFGNPLVDSLGNSLSQ